MQHCPEGDDQHHQGENSPERNLRHVQGSPDSDAGTDDGWHADAKSPAHRQHVVAVKAQHRADVLRQHSAAIGTVGNARRKAEEDQQRQRQEGSTAGDDIDHSGDEADGEQRCISEPGHSVSLSRVTRPRFTTARRSLKESHFRLAIEVRVQ